MFDNMSGDEWTRLDSYLYSRWDLDVLPLADIQVIRRDLLELSFKVQEWVNDHEDDTSVTDKAADLDLNILYLLRDLDWRVEEIGS